MRTSLILTPALLILAATAVHAEDVKVTRLRVQQVGDDFYFRVLIAPPADLVLPDQNVAGLAGRRWQMARLPRLVPQDDRTSLVYLVPDARDGLEFLGRVHRPEEASLLLLYPTIDQAAALDAAASPIERAFRSRTWAEAAVRLDFPRAEMMPHLNPRPSRPDTILYTNLERLWARAQAIELSIREALADDFGFYTLAREATNRKYAVKVEALGPPGVPPRDALYGRLYQDVGGSAALLAALERYRLLGGRPDTGLRSVDVSAVPTIEAGASPWERLLAGRTPIVEPLAKLAPHDHYYVHFKDLRKALSAAVELGRVSTLMPALDGIARDEVLLPRYEWQLGLRGATAKLLESGVVKGVAVTGSDLRLREGSDVTLLFQVTDTKKFLAAAEAGLDTARREFGPGLKEMRETYLGVVIESFRTRFREVSLYRAVIGDVVVSSNSPAAVRRVVDAAQGKVRSLAAAQDFQYLRTVFKADDREEDGFLFLSDAFLRRQASPAVRIKQKRRLEALASLRLATDAALFAAWETGKLPSRPEDLLPAAGLPPEVLDVPEGRPVEWYAGREEAVSEVYNTIHFATPLLELPLDRLTRTEERDYLQFRTGYLNLGRRYLDPIGVRLKVEETQVRLEAHLVPLAPNSQYHNLRTLTGGGTTKLAPGSVPGNVLLQVVAHLHPDTSRALGGWASLRLEDGADLGRLADAWVRQDLGLGLPDVVASEAARLAWQAPWLGAVRVGDAKEFQNFLGTLKGLAGFAAADWEESQVSYRSVSITRWRARPNSPPTLSVNLIDTPRDKQFLPAVYHARVEGVFYAALSEDVLKRAIDRVLSPPAETSGETLEGNGLLYVAPRALVQARSGIGQWLEFQCQQRALAAGAEWYALYHPGLLPSWAGPDRAARTAWWYLGYVPVSPDGSAYEFDPYRDEVINRRYGSYAAPRLERSLAKDSPLGSLLETVPKARAEVRFDDNGVQATMTIERTVRR